MGEPRVPPLNLSWDIVLWERYYPLINTVPSPNPLRQDLVSETGVSTSDARTPGPTGAADSALLREERIDYGEADSAAVEQEEEEQHDDDEGVHFLHLFF